MGPIEHWAPKGLGKLEYRDARKSRWGELWVLGVKARTSWNRKIGGAAGGLSQNDPTFLAGKKVARLGRKRDAGENLEMVRAYKEKKERVAGESNGGEGDQGEA
ncbi:hypothetical protein HOY82DRAFT_612003 [Tuber indicum]|nr:hypothetical protein HOY82DRAFT_612003 [Tuber indicum]